jgi:predicted transcriptional regulator
MEYLSFIKKIASTLNLSKTDVDILKSLIKEKLLVSEIAKRIKRSERHVRQRLHLLVKKGILVKEIEVLKNKRLAYRYSLRSINNITNEIRGHFLKKIDELDKLIV